MTDQDLRSQIAEFQAARHAEMAEAFRGEGNDEQADAAEQRAEREEEIVATAEMVEASAYLQEVEEREEPVALIDLGFNPVIVNEKGTGNIPPAGYRAPKVERRRVTHRGQVRMNRQHRYSPRLG